MDKKNDYFTLTLDTKDTYNAVKMRDLIAAANKECAPDQLLIVQSKNDQGLLDGPVQSYKKCADGGMTLILHGCYKDGKKEGLWSEKVDDDLYETMYSGGKQQGHATLYSATFDEKNRFEKLAVAFGGTEDFKAYHVSADHSAFLTKAVRNLECQDIVKGFFGFNRRSIERRHDDEINLAIKMACKKFDWAF
jgi:hypothetical protein